MQQLAQGLSAIKIQDYEANIWWKFCNSWNQDGGATTQTVEMPFCYLPCLYWGGCPVVLIILYIYIPIVICYIIWIKNKKPKKKKKVDVEKSIRQRKKKKKKLNKTFSPVAWFLFYFDADCSVPFCNRRRRTTKPIFL